MSLPIDLPDVLVDEVETTLQELGFKVIRPDAGRAATNAALLEDLEVVDGDWNTLVEVRGYAKGGGKTQDLQRIERFVAHYVKRTGGSFPSARWYVVNHSFLLAPGSRPRVLPEPKRTWNSSPRRMDLCWTLAISSGCAGP